MTRPTADLVVLAYSGGLDTTVTVHRLVHEQGRAVVALLADVGQGEDLPALAERALAAGALDAVVVDARERFAADFLVPAVRANALYEGRYPLVSALSRPLIAQLLVEEARHREARAVAHGCTGKGNDQVRFEVSCGALAPDLEILAPVRDSAMSRPEAIAYADKHGLDLGGITEAKPYSVDQNLWGRTIEAGVLEDPWLAPPEDAFEWTASPAAAGGSREVVVGFREGERRRRGRGAGRGGGGAQPAWGRGRVRAGRHGGEPAGRHQEPRDLRGARGPGHHRRPPRPRGPDPGP
jgi:argininosuccinate synthase